MTSFNDSRRIFRRASQAYVALNTRDNARMMRSMAGRGGFRDYDPDVVAHANRTVATSEQTLKRLYRTENISSVITHFQADELFCKKLLEQIALELGRSALSKMESVHRNIWNRYLHETPGSSENLHSFARALSSWLVFTAGAPYPALQEDEAFFQNIFPLGALPPEPDTVEYRPPQPIAGPRDEADETFDPMDAGVPMPENPEPGQPGGLDLPYRFTGWGRPDRDHVPYALAFYSGATAQNLQYHLLREEVGGHPLLLMMNQKLSDQIRPKPSDYYLMLRKRPAERDLELLARIRKIEQYLVEGLNTYRTNLHEEDWEELRPLLMSARMSLASGGAQSAEGRFGEHLISDIVGITPTMIFTGVTLTATLLVGVLLIVPSGGTSGILSSSAFTTAMIAFDVAATAVSIAITIDQYMERSEANRFAAIDEGLRVATRTDGLEWNILFDVLMLTIPPIVISGVSVAWRAAMRRTIANIPETTVAAVRTPMRTRVAREAAEGATGPTARGTGPGATGTDPLPQGGGASTPPGGRPPGNQPLGGETPRSPRRPPGGVGLDGVSPQDISRLQTALSGDQGSSHRVSADKVREYLRAFIDQGASPQEAVNLTNRWAVIQQRLGDMGTPNLPHPDNLEPLRRWIEDAQRHNTPITDALSLAEEAIRQRAETLGLIYRPEIPRTNPEAGMPQTRRRSPTPDPAPVAPRPVIPTGRSGLIEYGSTDLSQAVVAQRAQRMADTVTPPGTQYSDAANYAALEYIDAMGDSQIIVRRSIPRGEIGTGHAERRLLRELDRRGIDPEAITRLYTERSPCRGHSNCHGLLQRRLSERARVSWSFDHLAPSAALPEDAIRRINILTDQYLMRQARPGSTVVPVDP